MPKTYAAKLKAQRRHIKNSSFDAAEKDLDTVQVCVWPDNTWCFIEDLEQYNWKSDDYSIMHFNIVQTDDDIDNIINGRV